MTISRLLKTALRRHKPSIRARGRVIQRFAKKLGLVYLGVVDQHVDEHEVIRGLTVSTTHQDTHYAVGSYDGLDISIVDRFDIIQDHTGHSAEHNWVIMQLDLHPTESLPHVFLKPLNHSQQSYDKFFNAYHHLQAVNPMLDPAHSSEFHGRYELYTVPARALELEQVLTPTITNTIAARSWPHAIEIFENKLYLYTTETTLTSTLLEAGIESAMWLARVLSQESEA